MKKVISILVVLFTILTVNNLFAQSSSTKTATAGNFTTDVDLFSSVTDWSAVKLDKHFEEAELDTSNINFGAAQKIDSLYLAEYIKYSFPGTVSGSTNSDDYYLKSENINAGGSFTTAVLLGSYMDFVPAIKLVFTQVPQKTYTETTILDVTTITSTDNTETTFGVEAGLNVKADKLMIKPYVNFYTYNIHNNTQDAKDEQTHFCLTGGAKILTAKKNNLQHVFLFNGNFYFGDGDPNPNGIINAAYKIAYDLSDKASLAARLNIPFTYSNLDKDNTSATLGEIVSLGAQLKPTQKLNLNFGAAITLPGVTFTTNINSGTNTKTQTTTTTGNSARFFAGLSYKVIENFLIDTSFSLTPHNNLGNALGNLNIVFSYKK